MVQNGAAALVADSMMPEIAVSRRRNRLSYRSDPAHTVKEHPTHRQLVIGARYLAEARLRLVVALSGKPWSQRARAGKARAIARSSECRRIGSRSSLWYG
jgi:hypothetical protein